MSWETKTIAIAGGARGIGLGLAKALAAQGAAVAINDSGVHLNGEPGEPDMAERVAEELAQAGARAVGLGGSIADPAIADRLVDMAVEKFGALDGWVNAATIARDRMSFNMSNEEWTAVIQNNLNGAFFGMRAALRRMREQKAGRVVQLISTAGLIGNFGQANYAASKGGIFALTRVAALEMQRYGVMVNCVAPFAHTRMTDSIPAKTPEQLAYLDKARKAKVEHIAPLLMYLLSDAAEGVSGQIFGARGAEIYLFSQPRPVRTIGRAGGWTEESIGQAMQASLRENLVPLQTDLELFQSEPLV